MAQSCDSKAVSVEGKPLRGLRVDTGNLRVDTVRKFIFPFVFRAATRLRFNLKED